MKLRWGHVVCELANMWIVLLAHRSSHWPELDMLLYPCFFHFQCCKVQMSVSSEVKSDNFNLTAMITIKQSILWLVNFTPVDIVFSWKHKHLAVMLGCCDFWAPQLCIHQTVWQTLFNWATGISDNPKFNLPIKLDFSKVIVFNSFDQNYFFLHLWLKIVIKK